MKRSCLRLPVLFLGFTLIAAACSPSSQPPPVSQPATTSTPQSQNSPAALPEISLTPLPIPTTTPSHQSPRTFVTPPVTPAADIALSTLTPTLTAPAYQLVIEVLYRPWEQVLALAWSPDGKYLAAAAGETIYLLSAADFTQLAALPAGVWSSGLAFDPEGHLLASAGRDGYVQIWDIDSRKQVAVIQAHKKGANCVAFSPDGRLLASGGNDGMVRLWDTASGQPSGQIIGGTFSIPDLAFSLYGDSIAIANGDIIRFRDTATLRFAQTLKGENSYYSLDISSDGSKLAAGNTAGSVELWDLAGGEMLYRFDTQGSAGERPAGLIWQVFFNPDGNVLSAAAGDGSVWLWEISGGELLARLPAHSLAATSVAFSPDGHWLATGGLDGAVRVWQATLFAP